MIALPKRYSRWFLSLCLGGLATLMTPLAGKTAENIFFTYGPVRLTVRVASVENFVKNGVVDDNLRFLFNLIGASNQDLERLREVMQVRPNVSPIVLSKFFNSSLGENILARAGFILNIPWSNAGEYGIRSALIKSALDPKEGLTLLSFIQNYPTDIHFNGEVIEERAKAVDLIVRASEYFIEQTKVLSAAEAEALGPVDFSQLPNPTTLGTYGVAPKQRWQLIDTKRDRRFYVDVYRPQRWKPGKTPVVILSHGLASRPEDFDLAAEKLASYGFVVALPQHPGSDFLKAQALLQGEARQGYDPTDFIDRPLDISYVIDELERRNQSEFGDRLNLTQVGVGGHSFGGYGALAVAGATIDWETLESECQIGKGVPNTALILQCDALTLPRKDYQFKDPRVAAVLAANPVNSAIFGVKGLQQVTVPTMMMGGSYDPATPFVLEQARSFPRLGSQEKYLSLMEGQAHVDFSRLDANVTNIIKSIDEITLPDPNLLHSYGAAIVVPFFQVHIAQEESFWPLLKYGAAYSAYLSQDQPFKFFLISQYSEPALIESIKAFRQANGLPPMPYEFPLLLRETKTP
ncbi:MAG: alpha/beta hydrolase [Synechocystis sp.]|jgi:predicted dienelactone hydrolase